MEKLILKTEMPDIKFIRNGKVRDIYDLGDSLLLIASDRISAFDVVLPNGIPGKGKLLTRGSRSTGSVRWRILSKTISLLRMSISIRPHVVNTGTSWKAEACW